MSVLKIVLFNENDIFENLFIIFILDLFFIFFRIFLFLLLKVSIFI